MKSHKYEDIKDMYYIQDSRQYVGNCVLWWAKGGNGYTCNLLKAALYTEEEAKKICSDRETDIMRLVMKVDFLAGMHVDIQDLKRHELTKEE